jgi:hypothetical protein
MTRLGEHDGVLCIVCPVDGWNEPERSILFYPVGNGYGDTFRAHDFVRGYGDLDAFDVSDGAAGAYYITAKGHGRQPIRVTLQHGGKTTPVHVEREPIAAPWRAHKGFRAYWRDGHWFRESLRTGRTERAYR